MVVVLLLPDYGGQVLKIQTKPLRLGFSYRYFSKLDLTYMAMVVFLGPGHTIKE